MLGIGIFLTPPLVASYVHNPFLYILLWIAGGCIAFAGAVVYAELASRYPRAGGDYVYIRLAFGKSVSFAAGTILYAGIFAGSAAAMAVPLAEFQIPVLLSPVVVLDPNYVIYQFGFFRLSSAGIIGIGILLFFTLINVAGTRLSVYTQLGLTLIPVTLLGAGSVYLLFSGDFILTKEPTYSADQLSVWSGITRATLAIYFTYAGWNALSYIASEIKVPQKTIPVSLFTGIFIITSLYVLLATTFYLILGPDALSGSIEAGSALAATFNSLPVYLLVVFLIVLALAGSLNSTILGGSYTGLAIARDHTMFKPFAKRHAVYQTPTRSAWVLFCLSAFYITTGTFEMLIELTGLAMFLLSGLTVLSLFTIRTRTKSSSPYSATGYPWIPGLFLLISFGIITDGLYRGLLGPDALSVHTLYPLLGLFLFAGLWAGHAAVTAFKCKA